MVCVADKKGSLFTQELDMIFFLFVCLFSLLTITVLLWGAVKNSTARTNEQQLWCFLNFLWKAGTCFWH